METPEPTPHGDREITELLLQLAGGQTEAMDRRLPLVYSFPDLL
jgi:hypothetical protein